MAITINNEFYTSFTIYTSFLRSTFSPFSMWLLCSIAKTTSAAISYRGYSTCS